MPEDCGHAEVGELEQVVLVEEEMLGPDVPVADPLLVQVLQTGDQLVEEPVQMSSHKKMSHKSCLEMFRPLSLVLGHPDIRLDPIEELAAAAVLQEDELSPALRPAAVALHHVLVLQQLVHTDLLLHAVLGLGVAVQVYLHREET